MNLYVMIVTSATNASQ